MGLPVWRDIEEKSSSSSSAAVSRVKNDSTASSRSPIRRLRSQPGRPGLQRLVPDAPWRLTGSSDDYSADSSRRTRPSRPDSFVPPPLDRHRPQSRNGLSSSLPTPPLDISEPAAPSRIVLLRPSQPSPHPLSFAHRPLSPDDGLGDRNRSPSPPAADSWHVIASTITPDSSLPSTNSSFTSTQASASFANPPSTQPTQQSEDSESPIIFSLNSSADLVATHDRRAVERLLYDLAMQTAEGRAQIQLIRRLSPDEAQWMSHHNSQSQQDNDEEEDDNEPAPTRRPSQFDSDIRERSRQVANQTIRYFSTRHAYLDAIETPPRSASASPRHQRSDASRRAWNRRQNPALDTDDDPLSRAHAAMELLRRDSIPPTNPAARRS